MIEVKDKWALITGASRGIGKDRHGVNLVLHSRSVEHTCALAEKISGNGVRAISLQADLSDRDQITTLITDIRDTIPQIAL